MKRLQRRLSPTSAKKQVPGDVKAGHFAVHAIGGSVHRRFMVELSYLTRPDFLKLLERAEAELGFDQAGVLAVPCHPDELQKVLRR
ncbi:SAUR family [Musa troglodytarum]|uniref:SAUR family n=2 Tax=Musa troglodytarum TaxID=320322 RepID=A0A9E7IBR9_9LILI|nr:SAUR family [Musa troglodytarum]